MRWSSERRLLVSASASPYFHWWRPWVLARAKRTFYLRPVDGFTINLCCLVRVRCTSSTAESRPLGVAGPATAGSVKRKGRCVIVGRVGAHEPTVATTRLSSPPLSDSLSVWWCLSLGPWQAGQRAAAGMPVCVLRYPVRCGWFLGGRETAVGEN